ncbi:hypothetical protein EV424DRAFT_1376522 [Suillus variegatus]|nr:hypothetical protein EV424DRAFT_1376522 [Suillus variegatus]
MMFTSRLTIFALLTFLAGVNAGCAACEETLYGVDSATTYKLVSNYEKSENGYTECGYMDKKGDSVTCEYKVRDFWTLSDSSFSFDTLDGHQDDGWLVADGDSKCPKMSKKNDPEC